MEFYLTEENKQFLANLNDNICEYEDDYQWLGINWNLKLSGLEKEKRRKQNKSKKFS